MDRKEKSTLYLLKHLFYKEWIKTRWAFFFTLLVGLLSVWHIFTLVSNKMELTGAKNFTLKILYADPPVIYYIYLKYIPLIIAVAIGLSQFVPELIKKRYRLLLHLPAKNEFLIMSMSLFGLILLSISYCIIYTFFLWQNTSVFPSEVTVPVLKSLIPWFLSGYFIYNFIVLITLEPKWSRRIVYLISLYLLSDYYLVDIKQHGAYSSSVPVLLLMVVITMPLLFYSYKRLNKGI